MGYENGASQAGGKTIIAFGGGRGGTGKTFAAASLATLLARQGSNVVVFDGDLGGPNLHTALGAAYPEKTLSDFFQGAPLVNTLTSTRYQNLKLIPGVTDPAGASNPSHAVKQKLVRHLKGLDCDYLLMDLEAGSGFNALDLFLAADIGVFVVTPERSSVELMYHFMKALLIRRLKNIANRHLFESYINEAAKNGANGNMVELVEKVAARVAVSDKKVAARLEDKAFEFNTQLLLNMTRDHRDQFMGPPICDVAGKFYGFQTQNAGAVPYDERVILAGRKGEQFIEAYTTSETAAHFSLVLNHLIAASESLDRDPQIALSLK